MGLSDQERNDYVFNAIKKMVQLAHCLKEGEYPEVQKWVGKLWPATLGHNSNSAHWILGSSATDQIHKHDTSVFSLALRQGFAEDRENIRIAEAKKQDPNYKSIQDYKDENYDSLSESLSIANLLHESNYHYGRAHSMIYQIFAWSEQLVYGLRRYDDDYVKELQELSDVVSSLQGACFDIFEDVAFRKAYLSFQIFEIIFKDKKLSKIFNDHYLCHDLNKICADYSIEKIMAFYERLCKNHSVNECIYVAFEIAGRHCHYKHVQEQYVELFKKNNIKVDLRKLNQIFKNNHLAHVKHDKEDFDNHAKQSDNSHFYCIYGKYLKEE